MNTFKSLIFLLVPNFLNALKYFDLTVYTPKPSNIINQNMYEYEIKLNSYFSLMVIFQLISFFSRIHSNLLFT